MNDFLKLLRELARRAEAEIELTESERLQIALELVALDLLDSADFLEGRLNE